MLKADGFDKAVIGICRCKGRSDVIAYDYEKCLDILMKRDKMTEEEAIEFMEYNVVDASMGEGTPAFISKDVPEDIAEDIGFKV